MKLLKQLKMQKLLIALSKTMHTLTTKIVINEFPCNNLKVTIINMKIR